MGVPDDLVRVKCKTQQRNTCSIVSLRIAFELTTRNFNSTEKEVWDKHYNDIVGALLISSMQMKETIRIWNILFQPISLTTIPPWINDVERTKTLNSWLAYPGRVAIFSIFGFAEGSNFTDKKTTDVSAKWLHYIPYNEYENNTMTHTKPKSLRAHAICCVATKGDFYVMHDSFVRSGTCRKYIHKRHVSSFGNGGIVRTVHLVKAEIQHKNLIKKLTNNKQS